MGLKSNLITPRSSIVISGFASVLTNVYHGPDASVYASVGTIGPNETVNILATSMGWYHNVLLDYIQKLLDDDYLIAMFSMAFGRFDEMHWGERLANAFENKLFMMSNPSNVPNISYKAHVQNIGWMPEQTGTSIMLGTTGQNLRLEVFKLQFLSTHV